jgi:hypothetical protein
MRRFFVLLWLIVVFFALANAIMLPAVSTAAFARNPSIES